MKYNIDVASQNVLEDRIDGGQFLLVLLGFISQKVHKPQFEGLYFGNLNKFANLNCWSLSHNTVLLYFASFIIY